jgi:hypothetical protein
VLVCFGEQVRAYRRGEVDILMDQPPTRTDPVLDDTLSSVFLLPVFFALRSFRLGQEFAEQKYAL